LVSLDYVIAAAINVALEKLPSSSSVINTFHDLASIIAPSDTCMDADSIENRRTSKFSLV
jgi:hypothetical protein